MWLAIVLYNIRNLPTTYYIDCKLTYVNWNFNINLNSYSKEISSEPKHESVYKCKKKNYPFMKIIKIQSLVYKFKCKVKQIWI